MFNNLLYILVAVIALETVDLPPAPALSWSKVLLILAVKALVFRQGLRLYPALRKISTPADYFRVEVVLSATAVLMFLVDLYLLDLPYYLGRIPLVKQIPVLGSLAGLTLLYLYLGMVWLSLRKDYEYVFAVSRTSPAFLGEQFRNSAVVAMPWLILSLLSDLLYLVPSYSWQVFLSGDLGEPLVFLGFLGTLPFWYPGLLLRMTGCRPLPPGELRGRIEAFCRKQNVAFKEICSWPLFAGRVLSAGVVGVTGRSSYLILTPALLEVASPEELEAVLAHEIGHVKKHHLLLYLMLFMAFGILLQFALEPLLHLILGSQLFLALLFGLGGEPLVVAPIIAGLPVLLALLLYFRFVFGFFMRNFERQADLYAYQVMGGAGPLSEILEKIARLGGNIRDRPNWHHFGIGQRVDYLRDCQEGRQKPSWHGIKVYGALALFALVFVVMLATGWQLRNYLAMVDRPGAEFAEGFIAEKLAAEPNNPLWHLLRGDMLAGQKRYAEAVAAYEKSLALQADNPEVLNNLAWLLLTAEAKAWRDPVRGLELAKRAAALSERSHVLDTLAEAQWQNGEIAQAILTERQALAAARENREYYQGQLKKFQAGPFS